MRKAPRTRRLRPPLPLPQVGLAPISLSRRGSIERSRRPPTRRSSLEAVSSRAPGPCVRCPTNGSSAAACCSPLPANPSPPACSRPKRSYLPWRVSSPRLRFGTRQVGRQAVVSPLLQSPVLSPTWSVPRLSRCPGWGWGPTWGGEGAGAVGRAACRLPPPWMRSFDNQLLIRDPYHGPVCLTAPATAIGRRGLLCDRRLHPRVVADLDRPGQQRQLRLPDSPEQIGQAVRLPDATWSQELGPALPVGPPGISPHILNTKLSPLSILPSAITTTASSLDRFILYIQDPVKRSPLEPLPHFPRTPPVRVSS